MYCTNYIAFWIKGHDEICNGTIYYNFLYAIFGNNIRLIFMLIRGV